MFVDGAVFGGFPRALHSLSKGTSVVILISGNAHLPAEVIWNQARALSLAVVLFLSSQFPFLHLSSSVSPDIISLSTRSLRRYGELAKAPFGLFLIPCFCVHWECCCIYASGLFLELQWMGICDSAMGRITILFMVGFLISGVDSLKIHAYFNETADLPCQFANSQNLSLSELVAFWQNQENLVLNEVYLGKEKFDSVHSRYMGRTSFDPDSWTLRLHNLQITDKGLYRCIIHHKKPTGMIRIHQMNSDLLVLANFSQPEIVPISNITENLYINLTCSSIHGYPEPEKMSFLLITKNSTTEYDGVIQKSQDNVTELYDVSISLSVSFPDVTSNMTIFCVLQTKKTQLLSSPFSIEIEDLQPPPDRIPWIAAVLLAIIICVMMVFCLLNLWKWKKKQQPCISCECEHINMERGESEQTQERDSSRWRGRSSLGLQQLRIAALSEGSEV
uniref:T-lymphocyte activation antigen CD86 n=1 Tax=Callithrix jacchus TaxID=9483 RepID=A0A5F4W1P3_CALJA|nr:T-lymphocyte activation antigen CD86 isoform X1 [Callithrix jacchus]